MLSRLATCSSSATAAKQCLNRSSPGLLVRLTAARGFAVNFDRSKPHVNIGTIGHVDHGVSLTFSYAETIVASSPAERGGADWKG